MLHSPSRYIYGGMPLSFLLFFPAILINLVSQISRSSCFPIAHCTSTILSSVHAVDDMEPIPEVTCFLLPLASRGNA
jgi:hypothetical protein